MNGKYPRFNVAKIKLRPLKERDNDLRDDFILPLHPPASSVPFPLDEIAKDIHQAKGKGAATLFLCGAHVLRAGVQEYCFDLMRKGFIQGVAVNGAAAVHDFEIALQNATTESVARYIKDGRFGLWKETGCINDILAEGVKDGLGFGESLGRAIATGPYPFKDRSLFAQAWKLEVPVTVHVGIGYDIIHPHPNFDGAVTGQATYRDFLIFANLVDNLENGVVCTFGSAVMAPEVFLKALSMARNVAGQEGRQIHTFSSLVCDLHELPENIGQEAVKADARYYFRPWKTLLSRTVADGGRSFYMRGRHEYCIPLLWKALCHV